MTEKTTASEKELGEVHNEMAAWCLDILKGIPVTDKDGNLVIEGGRVVRLPPAPAYLNVIRQFLKDNDIQAEPAKGSSMGDLSDLPVFEDDNVVPLKSQSK
ncbi:terminase small subunit [Ralstonia phage DU_RP_I]|uniref:Uncharacterized protein n=1 Tax=Ralstonia phage DU_RP_I TaxID=2041493 RepID=A0A2D2W519_9CAUD|nr:terminase small subunit [Ralstonia phage DU_RP_I]ATS93398.1 hypothetical protein R1B41kb_p037 [Ralstonia phage DU_RP_I]